MWKEVNLSSLSFIDNRFASVTLRRDAVDLIVNYSCHSIVAQQFIHCSVKVYFSLFFSLLVLCTRALNCVDVFTFE